MDICFFLSLRDFHPPSLSFEMHNFSGFKPKKTNECCFLAMWKPPTNRHAVGPENKTTTNKQRNNKCQHWCHSGCVDWTFNCRFITYHQYLHIISLCLTLKKKWGIPLRAVKLLLIHLFKVKFSVLSPLNKQTAVSCTFQTVILFLFLFFAHIKLQSALSLIKQRVLQMVGASDENLCRLKHWGTEDFLSWLPVKSEAKAAARRYFYPLPGSQSSESQQRVEICASHRVNLSRVARVNHCVFFYMEASEGLMMTLRSSSRSLVRPLGHNQGGKGLWGAAKNFWKHNLDQWKHKLLIASESNVIPTAECPCWTNIV